MSAEADLPIRSVEDTEFATVAPRAPAREEVA
jgi:hypothetical protein